MVLNAGMTASTAIFFTIVIASLSQNLGPALQAGATQAGLPLPLAHGIASLPPGAAIFAAMLGYDPISHLIPASALAALPPALAGRVSDPHFFRGPFGAAVRDGNSRRADGVCRDVHRRRNDLRDARFGSPPPRGPSNPRLVTVAIVGEPMTQAR